MVLLVRDDAIKFSFSNAEEDGFTQTVGHYKLTVVPEGSLANAVSFTNERHVIVEYSSSESHTPFLFMLWSFRI